MKLKSLELFGFKSFAERTVIEFEQQVTGIVGPNGCGKSNVLDGVKWALGEMRARSLRGREMTDVIFNGSERRAPMDLAEVTLTFENDERVLPVDTEEVRITRRLYRTGESNYLINDREARLRDVRNLLMGTGLGPGGYAFMEQGKIDSVLASNPVDRRKVFEEAAGISRFRARRHETELKLDRVEANLLRLADIIEELARQQRSLKIQAGKAERYRENSRRASELQARVALHRYHENAARLEQLTERLTSLRARRDELQAHREELRTAASELEKDVADRREALGEARAEVADLAARETSANELMAFHSRQLISIQTRTEERRQEIARLENEVVQATEEHARVAAEAAAHSDDFASIRDRVAEARQRWEHMRGETAELDRNIESADAEVESFRRTQVELQREQARIDADERRWTDERERASADLAASERDREQLSARLAAFEGELAQATARAGSATAAVAESRRSLETLEGEIVEFAESHRQCVQERSSVKGRIDALDAHVSRHEGLDTGVRSILERRRTDAGFLPGFRGLLIDLFRADLERADAVEAALGDVVQAFVVETVEEALAGAEHLTTTRGGRAAFLPAAAFRDATASLPDGVTCDAPEVGRVLAALLDGVSIMSPEEVRRTLQAGEALPPVVVTPQGGIVRDGRVVISGKGSEKPGLVAVRAELDELRVRKTVLDERAAELEGGLAIRREKLEQGRGDLRARASEAAERDRVVQSLTQEITGSRRDSARADEAVTRHRDAIAASDERMAALAAERTTLQARLDELASAMARIEEERNSKGEKRSSCREQLEAAAAALEACRLEEATGEQRLRALEDRARHLDERRSDAERAMKRYAEELSGFAGDRERSAEAAKTEEEKAVELKGALESRRAEISDLEIALAEVRARHEAAAAELRGEEEALGEVGERVHQSELEESGVRITLENLVEATRNELEVELAELNAGYEPTDDDWDAIESELEELKDKLRRLGNVNLAAIDDLSEVEERFEFLTVQRNDLNGSRIHLARIISEIDTESTRLFVATFDGVREQFALVFRKLFGGGKAELTLLDPENPLESGIEITARPPGKEARSITLLSGGERTMTAVSLLFAIIRAHPCPCVLMDEVDAALDEDNVERFCRILEEFIERSQFMIITHNRRTMAHADVLYGVTMGERGVSRHVGVRFEDVEDDGSIKEDGARRPATGRARSSRSAGETNAPGPRSGGDPDDGARNGNGNGNGHAAAPGAAGEVVVEMSEAAEEVGDRTAAPAPTRDMAAETEESAEA